jgi:hypothetical protein
MWSAHARSIGAAAVRLSLPDRESGKRPQWSARLLGLIPSRGRPRVGPVPAWRRERQPGAHACAQRSGSSLNSERNVLPSAWSASAPQISLVSSARRASTICRRASLPSSQARPRAGGAQPLERLARYAPATAQPGVHRCHDGRRDRRLSGALPTSQALPATAASPCRHRIRQVPSALVPGDLAPVARATPLTTPTGTALQRLLATRRPLVAWAPPEQAGWR